MFDDGLGPRATLVLLQAARAWGGDERGATT